MFWINHRNTAGGNSGTLDVDEPANETYFVPGDNYATTRKGATFGKRTGASAFGGNFVGPLDPRLGGYHRLYGSVNVFNLPVRYDLQGANFYTFKVALSVTNSGNACAWAIFDGDINDPTNGATQSTVTTATRNYIVGQTYAVGNYVITNGKLYRATAITTGVSAGPAPSHASGSVVDGGVTWLYCRDTLLVIRNNAVASNANFVDASGAELTPAAWVAADGGAASVNVAVTSDHVTALRVSDTNENSRISAFGYEIFIAPLQDVTLRDHLNVAIAGNPQITARQPAGKPLAKIISANGDQTFAIDPTCQLAGYVAVQQFTAAQSSAPGYYVVSTGVPIPDSMAGVKTLGIKQSSAGTADHTTTFNVDIASSGGRTVETSVRGLIRSESWVVSNTVRGNHATGLWAPPANPTIEQTFDVNSAANFRDTWNAFTPTADKWYKFRLRTGTYEGGLYTFNSKNCGRNGGIIIEPYPGEDPEWNMSVQFQPQSGLWIRNNLIPGLFTKQTQYTTVRFLDAAPGATFWNRIKVENNRCGVMAHVGAVEVDFLQTENNSGNTTLFSCQQAESFEAVGNKFDGSAQSLMIFGVRHCSLHDNEGMRLGNDFIGWAPMEDYNNTPNATAFGDLNLYWRISDNTYHAEADFATYSNFKHGDYCQLRRLATTTWASGTNYSVGDKRLRNSNIYQCTVAGTSGATGPTGTGTGIVDGGVTWDWVATLPNLVVWMEFSGNDLISATVNTASGTEDRQFYFENLDECPWTIHIAGFDNAVNSSTVYGFAPAHAGNAWLEYNTLIGPPALISSKTILGPKTQSQGNNAKVYSQNNIVGQAGNYADGVAHKFNDVICDVGTFAGANNPSSVLQGIFADDGAGRAKWNRADGWTDGPARSKAETRRTLRKQIRPKAGIGAGCSVTIPITVAPGVGRSGASLDTTLTVAP